MAPNCERWNTPEFFRTATVEDVTTCLDAGTDVAARTEDLGHTPLHWAAGYNENPAVIQALLKAGADLRARNHLGSTSLHFAARYNENKVAIKVLVTAGVDPNARNEARETPLHWAAGHNEHPRMIEALLAAGANPNARDEDQETPLHWAARNNENPGVIEALLAAAVDPNARDNRGRAPLYYAAQHDEDPAAFAKLLARGAALNVRDRDNNGRTLLHAAASSENIVVVELLLAAGADPNAEDEDQETPLHEAAMYSGWTRKDLDAGLGVPVSTTTAVVELLLAAGASLAVRSSNNWTPLHSAAALNENPAVIEVLLAAGADRDARDQRGRTPLDLASPDNREVLHSPPTAGPATIDVEEIKVFRDCPAYPEMVVIPAGRFQMGCVSGSGVCESDEWPVHEVKVGSFALGRYEVSFEEYDCFARATGRRLPDDEGWGRGRRPVINVSWEDAIAYAKWLSAETGERYRLPSEAEWEYAARAGTTTRYSWGPYTHGNRASYSRWELDEGPAMVGSFNPNRWGLYDMHGNVREWVQDCWNENYQGAPADGSAWLSGKCSQRVLRSGARGLPKHLRSASRYREATGFRFLYNGFRVARTIVP